MKWVRYKVGDAVRYGIVEGDAISEVRGTPFGPHEADRKRHALADVKLLPPVVPQTFYAVGANYLAHAKEASEMLKRNQADPEETRCRLSGDKRPDRARRSYRHPERIRRASSSSRASWSP